MMRVMKLDEAHAKLSPLTPRLRRLPLEKPSRVSFKNFPTSRPPLRTQLTSERSFKSNVAQTAHQRAHLLKEKSDRSVSNSISKPRNGQALPTSLPKPTEKHFQFQKPLNYSALLSAQKRDVPNSRGSWQSARFSQCAGDSILPKSKKAFSK